ncbi:SDR family NAD(P)-dependent oxidoreductase [Peribacillus sp. SCS-26]|uniref:SDR family NAD(P)-dependent oxidoreductase n=1 Tax=Paraperibacillus marinus TaxID=3115295 RepID=UPI00390601FC
MRFQGSIALVTGGGSGIGKAAARLFAAEGAKVILTGRTEARLKTAVDDINAAVGLEAVSYSICDVTDEESVKALASFVKNEYGNLHILVNNAGSSAQSRILDTSLKTWDEVQAVNLKSVFLVSRELAKIMIAGIEPDPVNRAIVNVASLSGHQAGAQIPHYSSAKAGVIHFTKSLALELASYGIRVNSVSPGFIETPLTEGSLQNKKFAEAIKKNTALGRIGTAEEIATIIAFAASKEASYMTGTDILADGGWLLK